MLIRSATGFWAFLASSVSSSAAGVWAFLASSVWSSAAHKGAAIRITTRQNTAKIHTLFMFFPLPSRYHFSVPQHFQKITPWQNTNSLMHPWSAFVAHNKRFCGMVFLDKRLEWTQVCAIDPVRPLYFDGHFSLT